MRSSNVISGTTVRRFSRTMWPLALTCAMARAVSLKTSSPQMCISWSWLKTVYFTGTSKRFSSSSLSHCVPLTAADLAVDDGDAFGADDERAVREAAVAIHVRRELLDRERRQVALRGGVAAQRKHDECEQRSREFEVRSWNPLSSGVA